MSGVSSFNFCKIIKLKLPVGEDFEKVLHRNPSHVNYLSYRTTSIILILAFKIAHEFGLEINIGL